MSLPQSTAIVGTAYSGYPTPTTIPADDGTYSYKWTLSGAGAAGLKFSSDTVSHPGITGTPTTAGTATVTCTVTDSGGKTATGTASITVSAATVEGTQTEAPQKKTKAK